jgi:hypothetical protein
MMKLISTLARRAIRPRTSSWPVLNGFSEGRSLQLPAGELIAEEGVLLLRDSNTESGHRAVPGCDEAWIALKLDQRAGWYAIWCPHAARWEVLSFEVEQAAVPYARRSEGKSQRGRRAQ